MNRKIFSVVFVAICLCLCVIPSVCMIFNPSHEAIGNERQTEMPSLITEDGTFNKNFLEELGNYFSTHYAFRPQMISADAEIQSGLFGNSNLNSVVVGKDNWLYYSSTLDNFLGRNLMSDRAIFNTLNNLEITQRYLEGQGIDFLFTVAPNKNTLYPEYMPSYYSVKEREDSNLKSFVSLLDESKLNYCDLYSILSGYDEVLYHEQDSHWNNKGALIAYDAMLDSISKKHDDYADVKVTRSKNFYGDLGKMIYPSTQEPEFNFEYDIDFGYEYVTPTKSVEEAMIKTNNPDADGSLYMYRDSFGNALLPFFANAYNSAYFTKAFPVNLALETDIQNADTAMFVIAERNLMWFAHNPPVIPSEVVSVDDSEFVSETVKDIKASVSSVNMQYACIEGTIESDICKTDSKFIVRIKDNSGSVICYEAFTTSNDVDDFGFMAYVPLSDINSDEVEISLIVKNSGKFYSTEYTKININEAEI